MTAIRNHGGDLKLPGKKGEQVVIKSGAYLSPVPEDVRNHPLVKSQIAARTAAGVGGIEEIT